MDLTATSELEGEPHPKYQRQYSPCRSDRSLSRRRSPGHRRDSPPPRRCNAYRDERVEPRAHSSRHDLHAAAPLQPYPYSGDPQKPRVALAHNPYAPPPWSPPADPHRFQPYFGRHPRDRYSRSWRSATKTSQMPYRVSPICTSTASPPSGTCTWVRTPPAPTPREWGLVLMPAPGTTQFVPPPYALYMCLHVPAGVHYYRVCSGTDSWPRDVLSLVGAVHCVQVCGSHYIQFCRTGMPPTSLILPEHHHVVLPQSLHSRVFVAATGLTRASVLALAATYHPRHLRKWVRGLPHALPAAVARKLTRHPPATHPCSDPPLPNRPSPRPDIVTLNVQMSLRPKLRALDVLIRENQYPLTPHVQEAGPLIVQRVHPLYHTIEAPARVAVGCATLLYRAPDLTVTSHSAQPSGRALVTHFTVAVVAHCHANVHFPADGNLDTL